MIAPNVAPALARPAADRPVRGILLRSSAVLSFAVMAALIKLAAERGVSLVELIFQRNLFSLPLIVAWISIGPGWGVIRTERPKAHAIRSAFGLMSMMLNFLAISMLPLAEATTIGFSAPLFATMLSALILGEMVGRHRWSAVALGFVGVLTVMQPGSSQVPLTGAGVAILSALGVACVNVMIRQMGATEPAATTVFWFNIVSLAATGLSLPFFVGNHDPATWAILGAMGLAGGLAQICNTASLRCAPVSTLVPFDYAQLVWACLLGWLVWRQQPTLATLAGGAVIVASGLYTVWREHRLRRETAAALPEI